MNSIKYFKTMTWGSTENDDGIDTESETEEESESESEQEPEPETETEEESEKESEGEDTDDGDEELGEEICGGPAFNVDMCGNANCT